MNEGFLEYLRKRLVDVKEAGLYKAERVITSPQSAAITVADDGRDGFDVMCSGQSGKVILDWD